MINDKPCAKALETSGKQEGKERKPRCLPRTQETSERQVRDKSTTKKQVGVKWDTNGRQLAKHAYQVRTQARRHKSIV